MPTVYRAFLTSSEPGVATAERVWAKWVASKLKDAAVRWEPPPGDDRYDLDAHGWRLVRREEHSAGSSAHGVRWFLYEPEREDGARWITTLRATDTPEGSRVGGVYECAITVRGVEEVPSLAAPRLVRDLARSMPLAIDESSLGFDLIEAGTTDPGEVARRWAPSQRWLQLSVVGASVADVRARIDDPRRDVPIVLATSGPGEDFEDARPRAARMATALAGCATVIFAAGPESQYLADIVGPALRVAPWSGNVRVIPPGISCATAQFGDATLIPWDTLRRTDAAAATVIGRRVLPAVATRSAPQWMEDVWAGLQPGRRPEERPVRIAPTTGEAPADIPEVIQRLAEICSVSGSVDAIAVGAIEWIGLLEEANATAARNLAFAIDERNARSTELTEARQTAGEALEILQIAEAERDRARENLRTISAMIPKSVMIDESADAVETPQTCTDALRWAEDRLDGVRINPDTYKAAGTLDKDFREDRVRTWASDVILGLEMLSRYAAAQRSASTSVGSFSTWVKDGGSAFGLTPERIAMTETDDTKDRFGDLRVFATLDAVGGWSARRPMYAHLKIGHDKLDRPHSPRLHFEYVEAHGVVVIGYFGVHLTSASTSRIR